MVLNIKIVNIVHKHCFQIKLLLKSQSSQERTDVCFLIDSSIIINRENESIAALSEK